MTDEQKQEIIDYLQAHGLFDVSIRGIYYNAYIVQAWNKKHTEPESSMIYAANLMYSHTLPKLTSKLRRLLRSKCNPKPPRPMRGYIVTSNTASRVMTISSSTNRHLYRRIELPPVEQPWVENTPRLDGRRR